MRLRLTLILVGAIAVAATFTYPYWRPFFVNTIVDEPFPGLPADMQAAFLQQLTPEQQAAFLQMADTDRDMAVAMVAAALEAPSTVPDVENPPDSSTTVSVATASFKRIDAVHWAQGKAIIYQLPDNRKILRLEDFQAANGPDLHVLLSASENPTTQEEVELGNLDFELGPLKGNIGNQNYEIPPEVDLSLYNSVVIYCQKFHVVFSTATL
ncbi:MAG: DM13 domain-containing protein [Anaerolineae bacterium]|nr:DM13 domain-containing protein [Anaerolineae bacterium]